jgi:hypothetical protein
MIIGLLILSAVILNISMLPYPLWFKIAAPIVILAAIVCGYRLSSRRASSVADKPQGLTRNRAFAAGNS